MTFFFGESKSDIISHKIRMKEIAGVARQWDHPMKGLFKYATQIKDYGNDILSLPKKTREEYCVCLMALALMNESGSEWWTCMAPKDPPDGFVGTFKEVGKGLKGMLREVEVVENRTNSDELIETLTKKMTEKAYGSNTILTCLILTPDVYDFLELSGKISCLQSTLEYVFVVFSGATYDSLSTRSLDPRTMYTMVQLLPTYETISFDFKPYMDDFNTKYEKGQESRLIEGDSIYYGTSNPKFQTRRDNPS